MKTVKRLCWVLIVFSLCISTKGLRAGQDEEGVPAELDRLPMGELDQTEYPVTTTTPVIQSTIFKASALMGKTVETKEGETLASIKDLGLDLRACRVAFVALSTDDPSQTTLKAVPASALILSGEKPDKVCIDTSTEYWQSTPDFQRKQLLSLNEKSLDQQIASYFPASTTTEGRSMIARNAPKSGQPMIGPTPTGPESRLLVGNMSPKLHLKYASDLLGKEVLNHEGGVLGKASDVVVDLQGDKMAFLIVASKSDMAGSEQRLAVPLAALIIKDRDGNLRVDAPGKAFLHLRTLNQENWPAAGVGRSGVEIFRF